MKNIWFCGMFSLMLLTVYSFNAPESVMLSSAEAVTEEIVSPAEKVKWMTWEEAIAANEKEPKKMFVDVYTDWCGWCKRMDQATFQQPHIAKYLNENYYSIKFNAEQKGAINFRDKEYKFVSSGRSGYHELAAAITKGRLSFPTVVFFDEEMNVLQPVPGFQKPEDFERIITYFAGNHFKDTPWSMYLKSYQPLNK